MKSGASSKPGDQRIYVPKEPGKRHEPLVGPGIPIWSVVGTLLLYNWDLIRTLKAWEPDLSLEDVEAVKRYYHEHKGEMDARLQDNADVFS